MPTFFKEAISNSDRFLEFCRIDFVNMLFPLTNVVEQVAASQRCSVLLRAILCSMVDKRYTVVFFTFVLHDLYPSCCTFAGQAG
jgi:hypothetical protein